MNSNVRINEVVNSQLQYQSGEQIKSGIKINFNKNKKQDGQKYWN